MRDEFRKCQACTAEAQDTCFGVKGRPFLHSGACFLKSEAPQRGPEKAQVIFRRAAAEPGSAFQTAASWKRRRGSSGARLGPVWGLRSGPAGSAGGGWETGHGEFPAFGFRLFSLKEKKKKFEQKVQACVTDTNLTFCPDREKKQMSH